MADIDPKAIAQARAAGYSDTEIADHIAQTSGVKQAREAGYSDKEIIAHIVGDKAPAPEPSGAFAGAGHGYDEAINNVKETAKDYLGIGSGAAPEDPNYVPADITHGSYNPLTWNYGQLGQKAAELAPSMAQHILAAKAGAQIGKIGGGYGALAGGILGGAASLWASGAGRAAKQDAVDRTGDPNATPNASDLTRAGLTTGASALVQSALPLRFTGLARPVASVGTKGVLEAGKQLATTMGVGGATGSAGDAIDQIGNSIGTEKGARFDAGRNMDAALGNAVVAGLMKSPRTAVDAVSAANRSVFGGANEAPTAAYFKRLTEQAGAEGLSNTKRAYTAQENTKAGLKNELQDVSDAGMPQDTANALSLAKRGAPLTDEHVAAITKADPQAGFLAHQLMMAQQAQKFGSYDPASQNWSGGLSGIADKYAVQPLKRHMVIGGMSAIAGHSLMGTYGLPALATSLGAYAGSRAIDNLSGMRNPGQTLAARFADMNAQTRLQAPQPAAAAAPQQPASPAGPMGPWGPRPLPQQSVPSAGQQPAAPIVPGTAPWKSPQITELPQFNPTAMKMMNANIKAGLPAEPQAASAPAAPEPPAINPLMLPRDITVPAKNIVGGIANAQSARQAEQARTAVNGLPSPLMDAAPLNVANNPQIGKIAAQRVSAAKALQKYTAAADEPATPDASAPAPVAAAALKTKITKVDGKVQVEAPAAPAAPAATPWDNVGGFTPIPEHQMQFKGLAPDVIGKMSASGLPEGVPELRRLSYQNRVTQTHSARDQAVAQLSEQHPDAAPVLQQMLDQLHEPGNSSMAHSRRIVKHYAGLLSPEAGKAVRAHFDRPDVIDAIWPPSEPKKVTKKKNDKQSEGAS